MLWPAPLAALLGALATAHAHGPRDRTPAPAALPPRALWKRWCGKHYEKGSPADDALVRAGRTAVPPASDAPLLDFRCTPTVQPYLPDDATLSILVDADVTHDVGVPLGAVGEADTLTLTVTLDGVPVLSSPASISVGAQGVELALNASAVPVSAKAQTLLCTASSSSNASFSHTSTLYRLPANPHGGGATKMDRRTGALLRTDAGGAWRPFLPFGFYTYARDLMDNLTVVDQMAADGFNVIHLTPGGGYVSPDALKPVLHRADAHNILYMADFRDIYQDLGQVRPYVELFRGRKGLLAWYTTDEPDGPGDDPRAAVDAYKMFYEMDGYHPVSLVLNCDDYLWNNYTAGADILLSDPYPIAVDTTFSRQYGTPCNATYGCCGCDGCNGTLEDVGNRFDTYAERRRWAGRGRELALWAVPQAFNGTDEFWTRVPTGAEVQLQAVLGVLHGAVGIMPWDNPYDTPDIAAGSRAAAGPFTTQLAALLLDPRAARVHGVRANDSAVDAGAWLVPRDAGDSAANASTLLVLLANKAGGAAPLSFALGVLGVPASGAAPRALLGADATLTGAGAALEVVLGQAGVGAYVLDLGPPSSGGAQGGDGTEDKKRNAEEPKLRGCRLAMLALTGAAAALLAWS